MREIKFRAWDKQQNKWLDGDSLFIDGTGEVFTGEDWCGSCDQAKLSWDCEYNIEITQYTGLEDKNGKEIYEGDIIEGGYLNPLTNEFVSRKYLIEYKNGCFKGKLIGRSPYGDTWLYFIQGEIIGNIYENKYI